MMGVFLRPHSVCAAHVGRPGSLDSGLCWSPNSFAPEILCFDGTFKEAFCKPLCEELCRLHHGNLGIIHRDDFLVSSYTNSNP